MCCRSWNSATSRTGNVAGGQFRFDLNSVALARSNGADSQRVTGE